MSRKRSADSAGHSPSNERNKRQKFSLPADILEDILAEVGEVNDAVAASTVKAALLDRAVIPDSLKDSLEEPCSLTIVKKVFSEAREYLALSRDDFVNVLPKRVSFITSFHLDKIDKLFDKFLKAVLAKPSPSVYAKLSGWKWAQEGPGAILCLRPPKRRGLPLGLLYLAFSKFQQSLFEDLPNSANGASALRVALRLCDCMGDAFATEKKRGEMFDSCLNRFLPDARHEYEFAGEFTDGRVGRVYSLNRILVMIREDQNELETGDAYFQVARSYDLACEHLRAKEDPSIARGAPMFLLSMMGPMLTISGGFKDGSHTVVEPLCPTLYMLKDMEGHKGRAVQLAKYLLALKNCLVELSVDISTSPTGALPATFGCPRVFPSFKDEQDQTRSLRFVAPLKNEGLSFTAEVIREGERALPTFVKIVYGRYGEDVHRMLAGEGVAPTLFGSSRMEHGPTMVVMEMLPASQWQTLFDFSQTDEWRDETTRELIGTQLSDIVKKLKEKGFVHGDIRSNNIMVKKGENTVMVIDFDWAGKADVVSYPLERNPTITWPGPEGSLISLGHDEFMLENMMGELS